jgi:hypothetical protein
MAASDLVTFGQIGFYAVHEPALSFNPAHF